jgi:hypothetical protein
MEAESKPGRFVSPGHHRAGAKRRDPAIPIDWQSSCRDNRDRRTSPAMTRMDHAF